MTRAINYDHLIQDLPGGGRGLYVLPAIPEDATPNLREGLARRRIAALTGECPCGADSPELSRQQRRARQRRRDKAKTQAVAARAVFEHEPDCLAANENLIPLLREWMNSGEGQVNP